MGKAVQLTTHRDGQITFELDGFELTSGGDRLEVSGRWFGVRGRRFIRPTLTLIGEEVQTRLLADLEHKPWAAEHGEPWIAAFPGVRGFDGAEEAELAVSPDVTILLPLPGGAYERAAINERAKSLRSHELAVQTRARATSERDLALEVRDQAIAERDTAIAERNRAIEQRAEAIASRVRATAKHDSIAKREAIAERAPVAERRGVVQSSRQGSRTARWPALATAGIGLLIVVLVAVLLFGSH